MKNKKVFIKKKITEKYCPACGKTLPISDWSKTDYSNKYKQYCNNCYDFKREDNFLKKEVVGWNGLDEIYF